MTDKKIDSISDNIDIGQTLKNAREAQDISIATAAMQTNLSHSVLTKLEENQFGEIAAPVFTRGYLNIYARYLGLDATEISNAFNNISYEHQTDIRLTPANVASQQKSFKRNHALKWLLLVPLFLLSAFILMQVMNQNSWLMQQVKKAFPDNESTTTETIDAQSNEIVLQIDDPNATDTNTLAPVEQNIPSLTSLESIDDTATNDEETQNNVANALPDSEITLQVEENVSQETDSTLQETNDETPMQEPVEQTVAVSAGLLTITDENWVEVKDNTGTTVASRIFYKNETIALPADGSPYRLNIGRPNSIKLSINGEEKDLSSYKRSGSVRLFEVDIQ